MRPQSVDPTPPGVVLMSDGAGAGSVVTCPPFPPPDPVDAEAVGVAELEAAALGVAEAVGVAEADGVADAVALAVAVGAATAPGLPMSYADPISDADRTSPYAAANDSDPVKYEALGAPGHCCVLP